MEPHTHTHMYTHTCLGGGYRAACSSRDRRSELIALKSGKLTVVLGRSSPASAAPLPAELPRLAIDARFALIHRGNGAWGTKDAIWTGEPSIRARATVDAHSLALLAARRLARRAVQAETGGPGFNLGVGLAWLALKALPLGGQISPKAVAARRARDTERLITRSTELARRAKDTPVVLKVRLLPNAANSGRQA